METPTLESIKLTTKIDSADVLISPQVPSGHLLNNLRRIMKEKPKGPRDDYNKKISGGIVTYNNELLERNLTDNAQVALYVAQRLLQDGKLKEEEIFSNDLDPDYEQAKVDHTLQLFKEIVDVRLIEEPHRPLFGQAHTGEFYQNLPYLEVEAFTKSFLAFAGVRG